MRSSVAKIGPLIASSLGCCSLVESRFSHSGNRSLLHRDGFAPGQDIHGGQYTAAAMRPGREIETHFDAGQGSHQHQIIEMTDMADPKHLALDLVETGAKRHV